MAGGNEIGEYLSPGVYVEEVDMGPKPITGVSTSTVAFIGETNFVYKEGKYTIDLTNKPQAYYFPWIKIVGGKYIPPSGHVAGIYARSDSERGVHKAPANEIVRGCVGLKYHVTKGEQVV